MLTFVYGKWINYRVAHLPAICSGRKTGFVVLMSFNRQHQFVECINYFFSAHIGSWFVGIPIRPDDVRLIELQGTKAVLRMDHI